MDPEMPWLERSTNFLAEASCMLIVHITRWEDVCVTWRDARKSPRPPLHLKIGPNMPLTTRKPRGVHCFKFWRCHEKPGHPISSGDESCFPVFEWRGKPSFHKHLKRSFPLGICIWEGPSVLCFKRNGPRDALIRKKYKFPCRALCILIVHITRWKDVWVSCRDPRNSCSSSF